MPPGARIAVFDNDGTLWCERPTYPQAFFLLERLHVQASSDSDLAARLPGDREMLEYTSTGPLPSLAIVIDHDDEAREYAYRGASFTDPHAEPITDTAARLGWTAVSMRRDWARVFEEDVAG